MVQPIKEVLKRIPLNAPPTSPKAALSTATVLSTQIQAVSLIDSRNLEQPSVMDALASDLRLVVYGQLMSRYGIDKLKDQLSNGMLNDAWLQDLRGLNAETVKQGILHLSELQNPDWPPSSASFRKICINHLQGFPTMLDSMDRAMHKQWCNDGIIYAIAQRAGGTFWLERATDAAVLPRWKTAYYEIRDQWLNGMRYGAPPTTAAITNELQPERTNSPFKRRTGEEFSAMMHRYHQMERDFTGELPPVDDMLMTLVRDKYIESRMLNEWRNVSGHKKDLFIITVRQFYIAAYYSPKATNEGKGQ